MACKSMNKIAFYYAPSAISIGSTSNWICFSYSWWLLKGILSVCTSAYGWDLIRMKGSKKLTQSRTYTLWAINSTEVLAIAEHSQASILISLLVSSDVSLVAWLENELQIDEQWMASRTKSVITGPFDRVGIAQNLPEMCLCVPVFFSGGCDYSNVGLDAVW